MHCGLYFTSPAENWFTILDHNLNIRVKVHPSAVAEFVKQIRISCFTFNCTKTLTASR